MSELKHHDAEPSPDVIFSANFFILFISLFMGLLSFYALFFVLPTYLVSIGGKSTSAGIATGIFTIAAMSFRLVTGKYIDKYGCKKLILSGIGIYAISSFFYIWASNPLFIYLLRSLQGIGWGVFFVCSFTLASKLTSESRRGEAIGYFTTALPVGMALGPVTGDYLYLNHGTTTTFLIIGVISSIPLLSLNFFKEKRVKPQNPYVTGFISASAILPSVIAFIINVAFGAIITFLPLLSLSRDIINSGIFFTIYGAVVVLTRPIGGRLVDRYGHRVIVLPSLLCLSFSIALIAYSSTIQTLIIAGFLFGISLSFSFPAIMAMCVNSSQEEERGRAMATFTFAIDLGVGVGSMGLGFLLIFTDYTIIYLICSGLVLCGFFLWSALSTK